jgi:hypothetical protein
MEGKSTKEINTKWESLHDDIIPKGPWNLVVVI